MIPFLLLLLSVVLFRLAPHLTGNAEALLWISGFSPLMAFALCGGAFLPRKWAFAGAVSAVVIPHFAINALKGHPVLTATLPVLVVCVAAAAVAGVVAGKKVKLPAMLGLALSNTVLFHLVTNTVSFFTDPGYTDRSFTGWLQAQTLGLPAWASIAPAWMFLVKQLAGDLLFTAAFWLACRPAASAFSHTENPVDAALPVCFRRIG